MSLIARPLNSPVYSGTPVTAERAAQASVVFVHARPDPVETVAAEALTAPAATCSACEDFGDVLTRMEGLLLSLLADVENLRVRLDTVSGD